MDNELRSMIAELKLSYAVITLEVFNLLDILQRLPDGALNEDQAQYIRALYARYRGNVQEIEETKP